MMPSRRQRRSTAGRLSGRHALAGFALAFVVAVSTNTADAHPLHTTLTELTVDSARHVVRVVVRAFSDDLGAAMARRSPGHAPQPGGAAWDTAAFAYATSAFTIADHTGRPLTLRGCGIRRTGDLLWLCMETESRTGATGLQLRDAVLTEVYDDQVNIVQVTIAGARRSLLFTRGDGLKRIQ